MNLIRKIITGFKLLLKRSLYIKVIKRQEKAFRNELVEHLQELQNKNGSHSVDAFQKYMKEKFLSGKSMSLEKSKIAYELFDDITLLILAGNNTQERIVDNLNNLDVQLFSIQEWKAMYYIINLNGYYLLADKFREAALNCAINNYEFADKENQKGLYFAFMAYIDQHRFDDAQKIIDSFNKRFVKLFPTDRMQFFLDTIKGRRSEKTISSKYFDEDAEKFKDIIENKTIAVVGPAPTGEQLGEEIDSYDIVIRLNYRGKSKMPNADEFGSRIEGSYYNNENMRNLENYDNIDFLRDLNFLGIKSITPRFAEELKKDKLTRNLFSFKDFVFFGSYNMIPIALLDLIPFNPKSIKLFKTNFFASHQTHAHGYRLESNLEHPIRYYWRSHTRHNLISSLNLVRGLEVNNVINVDAACMQVLNYDNDQYLGIIENNFSS